MSLKEWDNSPDRGWLRHPKAQDAGSGASAGLLALALVAFAASSLLAAACRMEVSREIRRGPAARCTELECCYGRAALRHEAAVAACATNGLCLAEEAKRHRQALRACRETP